MPELKSPAGAFPTWPQKLPVDGEYINNDNLFTSGSADLGPIGKMIDAVGYLRDVVGYTALIATDGTGGASVTWQSNRDDGSDWITSVTAGASSITVNIADSLGGVDAWAVEAFIQHSTAGVLGTRRFAETFKNPAGTSFVIRLVSDSGTDGDPSATAYKVFVRLTKAAAL